MLQFVASSHACDADQRTGRVLLASEQQAGLRVTQEFAGKVEGLLTSCNASWRRCLKVLDIYVYDQGLRVIT